MHFRWMLIVMMIATLSVLACSSSSDSDDTTDGDTDETTDGDVDGDTTDGDDDGDVADGDEETDGDDSYSYPDPTFVFEKRNQPADLVRSDDPYNQEFSEMFFGFGDPAVAEVTALVVIDNVVYVGTTDGLFAKAAGQDAFEALALPGIPEGETPPQTITAIADNLYQGMLAVALADRVDLVSLTDQPSETMPFGSGPITAIAAKDNILHVASDWSVFAWTGDIWDAALNELPLGVRDLAITEDGRLLAAANDGILVFTAGTASSPDTIWSEQSGDLTAGEGRAVAVCGDRIVMATASGLTIREGDTKTLIPAGPDGIPTDNLLAVACNGEAIAIGYDIGASWIAADQSHKDYYYSRRWLADNRVPVVALDNDGNRWYGGVAGLSRIYLQNRTLADKERVMNGMAPDFFRMDGVSGAFMSSDGRTADPDDDPTTMSLGDKDNDGLWTQMMIGGWCMGYAVTGDEQLYDYARLAMNNMQLLVDVPGPYFEDLDLGYGFVARSLIREDEEAMYQSKVNDPGSIPGKDVQHWIPMEYEGWNYFFKTDTSSDEIAGHFFGFPVYYDLCAKTDEERAEVASRATAIAAYIIDHDFLLVDSDGTKTTHGHFSPYYISSAVDGEGACIDSGVDITTCFEAAHGGGWLNALEILGVLLSSYHMSGDKKFYDAYETLIREHRYGEVAMASDDIWTISKPAVANHSDHELAMLAYTTLIRYEPNDERRAKWVESLKYLYDSERPERNPWWTAVYAISGGENPDVDSAIRTLREIPDDLREWHFSALHRKDVEVVGKDRHGDDQLDTVLPYDEMRTFWWNGNPYDAEDGGDGRSWQAPTFWLLPYYFLQYAGVIQ